MFLTRSDFENFWHAFTNQDAKTARFFFEKVKQDDDFASKMNFDLGAFPRLCTVITSNNPLPLSGGKTQTTTIQVYTLKLKGEQKSRSMPLEMQKLLFDVMEVVLQNDETRRIIEESYCTSQTFVFELFQILFLKMWEYAWIPKFFASLQNNQSWTNNKARAGIDCLKVINFGEKHKNLVAYENKVLETVERGRLGIKNIVSLYRFFLILCEHTEVTMKIIQAVKAFTKDDDVWAPWYK